MYKNLPTRLSRSAQLVAAGFSELPLRTSRSRVSAAKVLPCVGPIISMCFYGYFFAMFVLFFCTPLSRSKACYAATRIQGLQKERISPPCLFDTFFSFLARFVLFRGWPAVIGKVPKYKDSEKVRWYVETGHIIDIQRRELFPRAPTIYSLRSLSLGPHKAFY